MGSTYYTKIPGNKPATMYLKGEQSFSRHKEHEQSVEVETWPIVREHRLQQLRSQAGKSKTLMVTVESWWKRAYTSECRTRVTGWQQIFMKIETEANTAAEKWSSKDPSQGGYGSRAKCLPGLFGTLGSIPMKLNKQHRENSHFLKNSHLWSLGNSSLW